MNSSNEGRKTRSDKKICISPYIEDRHRVWIHRISRKIGQPEGEIGIKLIQTALFDEQTILFFKSYFKRDYRFSEHVWYPGSQDALNISEYIKTSTERARFKVKASQQIHFQLCEFQYALGTPYLAHSAHALLRYALHDINLISKIAPRIEEWEIYDTLKPVGDIKRKSDVWSVLK